MDGFLRLKEHVATIILNYVSVGLDPAKIYSVKAADLGGAGILTWAVAAALLTRRYR